MAPRQGSDILMALVHAELTWQFSTPCQSSNYRLIDFKFVVGDYVPGYSNPAKFRLRRKTGGGSRWWWHIRFMWLFSLFLFFCFSRSRPVETRGPILANSSLKDAVWCKEVPFGVYNCNFTFLGAFYLKNTPKLPQNGDFPAKMEKSNNFQTVEDRWNMSIDH